MPRKIRSFSSNQKLIAERRKQIAKSAAKLFVKQGYNKTWVREIGAACGMSMGTLYHYVGSKKDILYMVIDQGMIPLQGFIDKVTANYLGDSISPTKALESTVKLLYQTIEQIEDIIAFIYFESKHFEKDLTKRAGQTEMQCIDILEQLLARGCKTGEFKIVEIPIVAHNILVLAHMWSVRSWFFKNRYTFDVYLKEQIRLLIKSIKAKA